MAARGATVNDKDALIASLYRRIEELELENQRLQAQLAHSRSMILAPTLALSARDESTATDRSLPADTAVASGRRPSVSAAGVNRPSEHDDAKAAEGLCTNCGREIPAASLTMHLLHCARNIKRCAACGKAIPVKEYDMHVEENRVTPSKIVGAVVGGDFERLDAFLQHGASMAEMCDEEHGDLPVHVATRARQLRSLQYLLQRGVSINASNALGETPLHVACMMAPPPNRGAASVGGDALDQALDSEGSRAGNPQGTAAEIISFLVTQGCDVEARNALGDTPLQLLQRSNNMELALLLTTSGSALRPSSRDNRTRPASASSLNKLPTPRGRQPSFDRGPGLDGTLEGVDAGGTADSKIETRSSRPVSARERPLEARPPSIPSSVPPRPVVRSSSFKG